MDAIVITPVKDSLNTTKQTIAAIRDSHGDYSYFVFNDYSQPETKTFLESSKERDNFNLIHLEDITDTPSPNYNLVLKMAQELALKENVPLIIVESDVIVKEDTFSELIKIMQEKIDAGVIGAITVDQSGNYNFPYTFEKVKSKDVISTGHSISFCCTLLTPDFLKKFSFDTLPSNKDWYDIYVSRQSVKLGFENYLAKNVEVLHLPHSSRPWKNLKYKNPFLYYIRKFFYKRDRI